MFVKPARIGNRRAVAGLPIGISTRRCTGRAGIVEPAAAPGWIAIRRLLLRFTWTRQKPRRRYRIRVGRRREATHPLPRIPARDEPAARQRTAWRRPSRLGLSQWLDGVELLCFDEFHVHDIADAFLIGRFLEIALELGTRIVLSSNYAPQGLLPNPEFHERFGADYRADQATLRGGAFRWRARLSLQRRSGRTPALFCTARCGDRRARTANLCTVRKRSRAGPKDAIRRGPSADRARRRHIAPTSLT